MKSKKKILLLFSILLIIIFVAGFFIIKYVKNKKNNVQKEFTPEEEISEDQNRNTIVTLYFPDKDTNLLKTEARLVSIQDLMVSPYNVIIELLVGGPKNQNLESVIPENVKLLKSSLDGDCLTLDFSEEFMNYNKENDMSKEHLIYSIVNTITELNEVNRVKFLVNGEINEEFNDIYVRGKM